MSSRVPELPPGVPPPTWSYFRDAFEDAPSRSAAWRTTGLWAVERLSKRLGDDWPERAWEKNGRLPGGMALAIGHPVAYVELLELAARSELLSDCEGFADVFRPLHRDPREDQLLHLRLELAVGALADQAGYGVRFERPIRGSSKHSDITIDLEDGQSLLVEARVLLPDARSVAINEFSERAFQDVHDVEWLHDVQCDGEFTEVLGDGKLSELLEALEVRVRLVKLGAIAPPLRMHGASLTVSRRGSGRHQGLKGPALEGDLWPRIADRLAQKARQTEGGENVWLRICALHGLWLLTDWATRDMSEKLASMRHNIASSLADHAHVDGVVISSGCGWPQGTIVPDECEDAVGGYAIRCCMPPMMARETLVVALNPADGATRQARIWRDLYASEARWLDYALARLDLPAVAEIFKAGQT